MSQSFDGQRAAATVVLARNGEHGRPELFLMRRHGKSGFMGGAHAFPGGKLEACDHSASILRCVAPGACERAARLIEPTPGQSMSADLAVGLFVAAARELFEEVGVVLARRRDDGGAYELRSPEDLARLGDWRARCAAGTAHFSDFLEAEALFLDLASMIYFAHWVTPSIEPRRFDARFFVLELPAGQTPIIDDHEATQGIWLTPTSALQAHGRGEMYLPPPTRVILRDFEPADSVSSLLSLAEAKSSKVFAILPKLAMVGDQGFILLPWDPLYPSTDGEALPLPEGFDSAAHPDSRVPLL